MEEQANKESNTEENIAKTEKLEIDLMDILRRIIAIHKTLYKAAGVGLLIGIVVALGIPKRYTVKVTLSPEMGSSKNTNGLAGLAASFLGTGATMTEGIDALNASLSPDIVSSTPFLLELYNMEVPVSKDKKESLAFYLSSQSSPWWNYVIGFPGMVIGGIQLLFTEEEETMVNNSKQGAITLTKEEARDIKYMKNNIVASVDKKTAITEVSVTLQDPKVAAVVADSVVHKLQESIIGYRTFKAKEDCLYLEKLFEERKQEYYVAQKKYASYIDSHDNLILQSVRAEQERLQNDMSLAYQVYSQVANQLQVARAKVQEEKPVFAVVEPAVVPLLSSSTSRKVYVLFFIFLSVIVTGIWLIFGKNFLNRMKKEFNV